jgi:diaminopimelate decarboxylase
MTEVRARCEGIAPLSARLEPWMVALCARPARLAEWLDRYGSPLNVLDPAPLGRNAAELQAAAASAGVELGVYLARKANKALCLVDEARRLGLGVDVASERELRQALDRRVPARSLVVTAAVKPRGLLESCVAAGATVVIDNEDELRLLGEVAAGSGDRTPVAFRLAPLLADRHPSRFGLAGHEILALLERAWRGGDEGPLTVAGVHFHLDGYDAGERIAALRESLALIDALRARGHRPRFIDVGGGIPMRYLDDADEWERFWDAHRAGLRGERPGLTFEGHAIGTVYPYHQQSTRGPWLAEVLAGQAGGQTIAAAIAARDLELRCEPGRSLLDGCGMTVARVAFRKQRRDGVWLIGVEMNRTQCRSTSDDFLVDPLVLRPGAEGGGTGPIEGYLVGAYCIERELLTWRRLRFPHGVQVGDLVVFPNTAGYLMHILESASHQIPLAQNVVVGAGGDVSLDPIDERARAS